MSTEADDDATPAADAAGVVASGARAAPGGGVWAPGRRLLTSGLVATITLVAFESLAISTVMPLVDDDLGDLWLYGWVFSAFFLGNLVGIVVAGRAADRVPPAVPFAVGLVLFLLGLVIGGAAPSMAVLVLGRALQGLGGGSLPAVAYVCIGRGYDPAHRPRMFALLSTAWVLPSIAGPAIAGVVGEAVGWRWVFLGLIPLSVVIGTMAFVGVRAIGVPAVRAPSAAPVVRAVGVAGGAARCWPGLGNDRWWAAVPLVVAGSALALPAFVALTPAGTLRGAAGLPAVVLSRGVLTFAFFSSSAFVPLALTSVKGVSPAVGGLALTSSAVLWTVGSWTQERLITRTGARRLVRTGLAVLTVATVGTLVSMSSVVPAAVTIVVWGIAGLGMGTAYSPLSVAALSEATPGREGAATSALQLSDTLGIALGTGVAGVIVAAAAAWADTNGPAMVGVFTASVVMAVTGLAVARGVPGRAGRV